MEKGPDVELTSTVEISSWLAASRIENSPPFNSLAVSA